MHEQPNMSFEIYYQTGEDGLKENIFLVIDGSDIRRQYRTIEYEVDETIDNVIDAATEQIMEHIYAKVHNSLKKHLLVTPITP